MGKETGLSEVPRIINESLLIRLSTHFPTDFHTNWQWFTMIKNSHPLILDQLPDNYSLIVQVIDNVERNHKLGMIQEFQCRPGQVINLYDRLGNPTRIPGGPSIIP